MGLDYERDAATIWAASFATIRAEADLSEVPADLERVVVRMIHASGDVTIPAVVGASVGAGLAVHEALLSGAPIFCDAEMVACGITRRRLPADNAVRCTLHDPATPSLAVELQTTRTAAAVDLWVPDLAGAVVAIGNAPTALFRLLELLLDGAPRPAAIVGMPVGFIGAAESKEALATLPHGVPYLTVHGRRGGSALAAAAVNALATTEEIV